MKQRYFSRKELRPETFVLNAEVPPSSRKVVKNVTLAGGVTAKYFQWKLYWGGSDPAPLFLLTQPINQKGRSLNLRKDRIQIHFLFRRVGSFSDCSQTIQRIHIRCNERNVSGSSFAWI